MDMTGEKKKAYLVKIDRELCKGCRLCVGYCPRNVLAMSSDPNRLGTFYAQPANMQDCIGCQACTLVCPDACVELFEISEDGDE